MSASPRVTLVTGASFAGSGIEESRFGDAPMAAAAEVAAAGWRGMMAGDRVVVPGLLNRLSRWAPRLAPTRLSLAVAGRLFARRR